MMFGREDLLRCGGAAKGEKGGQDGKIRFIAKCAASIESSPLVAS